MSSESSTTNGPRDTVFDVDVEQLARVYAQAALDAAGDLAAQDALVAELRGLVEEVLDRFPALEQVFSSALVSQDEKAGVLDRVFGSRLSSTALSFLKVMASHGRLGLLRSVVRSAGQLWERRSGRQPVELQLAQQVDPDLHREIFESLRKALGVDPVVTTSVNPDLIAGFVVRIGDKVYDASARASLERARQAMVAGAVEAIQRQPQRFMSSIDVQGSVSDE